MLPPAVIPNAQNAAAAAFASHQKAIAAGVKVALVMRHGMVYKNAKALQ